MQNKKKDEEKAWINWEEIFYYFIFYFSTTMSWLFSTFVEENLISLMKRNKDELFLKLVIPFWKGKKEILKINFEGEKKWLKYFFCSFIMVLIYSLIVNLHIFIARYLDNKEMIRLKSMIINKYFKLKKKNNEEELKRIITLIEDDVKKFSSYHYFGPNQIYYIILEMLYIFIHKADESTKKGWDIYPILYFLFNIAIISILKIYSYKRELSKQEKIEKRRREEVNIINNKNLIIKKGERDSRIEEYEKGLNELKRELNKKSVIDTAQYAIPSYLIIRYSKFLFLNKAEYDEGKKIYKFFDFYSYFIKLMSSTKKMVERLKEYPIYFSSRKRIKDFLSEEEEDREKGLFINEKINKIEIKNLNFSYENNNVIFENFNTEFTNGKLNIIEGHNGFGKSTLINIIFRIIEKKSGKILINDKFDFDDLNIESWREKIAYAENNNLLYDEKLSTGQKQFMDFLKTIKLQENDKRKEIFIFDEANSALDIDKKKFFLDELNKLSKEKIVILVTHENPNKPINN